MSAEQVIDNLRRRIPDTPCTGCGECCGGLVPWTAEEYSRLTDE
ncbi:MAG: hypothetical protein U9R79_07645 [Armatimonadota bacterium]|nr:hypothetical protein [Armatimonadota bacterium]